MKTKVTIALFLLLTVAIGIWVYTTNHSKPHTTIKIGILQPLTGEGSAWGQNAMNGIELAKAEIQKNSTKFRYEFIEQDSATNPTKAVSAFQKLVSADGIRFCVVDMISGNVLAISPIAEKNKVIIISPGASAAKITSAGDYVFRNWPSDALQGKESARIASELLSWKRIAILRINNDYGEGLAQVFRSSLPPATQITCDEVYAVGSNDFRSQLNKIEQSNPDGIYLLAYPQEAPAIFKQAREIGIDTTFLGTETFESNEIITQASDAAEGSIYTYPKPPDGNSTLVTRFRKSHLERFGKPVGVPADFAYDALMMLVEKIEEGNGDSDEVKRLLYQVRERDGASGLLTIDANGDAIKPFEIRSIHQGKFIQYKP